MHVISASFGLVGTRRWRRFLRQSVLFGVMSRWMRLPASFWTVARDFNRRNQRLINCGACSLSRLPPELTVRLPSSQWTSAAPPFVKRSTKAIIVSGLDVLGEKTNAVWNGRAVNICSGDGGSFEIVALEIWHPHIGYHVADSGRDFNPGRDFVVMSYSLYSLFSFGCSDPWSEFPVKSERRSKRSLIYRNKRRITASSLVSASAPYRVVQKISPIKLSVKRIKSY